MWHSCFAFWLGRSVAAPFACLPTREAVASTRGAVIWAGPFRCRSFGLPVHSFVGASPARRCSVATPPSSNRMGEVHAFGSRSRALRSPMSRHASIRAAMREAYDFIVIGSGSTDGTSAWQLHVVSNQ